MIRILSDLHNEFKPFTLPELETDKDDILVLAGDIGVVENPSSLKCVKPWIPRFKHTIMIQGNHELYGSSLLRALPKQKEIFKDEIASGKCSVVNNEIVRVDNISFICATLWTNYNGGNPYVMEAVRSGLNDYNYIRTGDYGAPYLRKIVPRDIFSEFVTSHHFIFDSVAKEKAAGQKTVVATHHGPSRKSIHPHYEGDIVNWGYVSELDQEIMDNGPNLYVHGHVHSSFDYMIGDTRVITNPRGYVRVYNGQQFPENGDFNPILRIEV
jgi:hypothetical protein